MGARLLDIDELPLVDTVGRPVRGFFNRPG
jgi:hypothetical protein